LPRLFVRKPLEKWTQVELDGAPAHYLANVLRLKVDAELLLFDGISGEWLAKIVMARKGRLVLQARSKTREPEAIPDVWLAFAPVKRAQTDWLVEKATELGAARLIPVMTQRTITERVKLERLQAISIEAAEQCGRTVLPEFCEPISLKRLVEHKERKLYFADEAGGQAVMSAFNPGPATILTGPEGGFTDEERSAIRAAPHAVPISLGPRILRAETAALAALTVYMALAGDWQP
jgi:16S rRNA (uracil1498-N3)-methyltransferase